MRRRGRPLGEKSLAVLQQVHVEPRPIHRLASDLQLNVDDATGIVRRLVVAGLVEYGDKVPGTHDRPARLIKPKAEAPSAHQVFRLFP